MQTMILIVSTLMVPAVWGGLVALGMTRLWPVRAGDVAGPAPGSPEPARTVDYQI